MDTDTLDIDEAASEERENFWGIIIPVRDEINKQLEKLRVDKVIGSSLDAEVDLYCSDDINSQLEKLGDELRFVMITSYTRLHNINEKPVEAIESAYPGGQLFIHAKASSHKDS